MSALTRPERINAAVLIGSLNRGTAWERAITTVERDLAASNVPLPELFEAYPAGDSEIARAVLAADFLRERRIVLEKLERLGIHCLDVPAAQLTTALLNRLWIGQKSMAG